MPHKLHKWGFVSSVTKANLNLIFDFSGNQTPPARLLPRSHDPHPFKPVFD
jgi:hypothetical protein